MNRKRIFALWGGLFVVCGALGFLPEPAGALRWLLTALSLTFFVPPALIVFRREREADVLLVRNLSALSLLLTLVLLVLNFLTAMGSQWLGTLLYYILVIVSSPMVCSGYWVVSLFLWACLLLGSRKALKKKSVS